VAGSTLVLLAGALFGLAIYAPDRFGWTTGGTDSFVQGAIPPSPAPTPASPAPPPASTIAQQPLASASSNLSLAPPTAMPTSAPSPPVPSPVPSSAGADGISLLLMARSLNEELACRVLQLRRRGIVALLVADKPNVNAAPAWTGAWRDLWVSPSDAQLVQARLTGLNTKIAGSPMTAWERALWHAAFGSPPGRAVWFMEDDVLWRDVDSFVRLLREFDALDADYIAAHPLADPRWPGLGHTWPHWRSAEHSFWHGRLLRDFHGESRALACCPLTRSGPVAVAAFTPLCRMSAAMLRELSVFARVGGLAFLELLFPAVAVGSNLTVRYMEDPDHRNPALAIRWRPEFSENEIAHSPGAATEHAPPARCVLSARAPSLARSDCVPPCQARPPDGDLRRLTASQSLPPRRKVGR
jgi:hypothetical protein